jgi:O-antigen/teichoic acid export membrane protein
MGNRPSNLDHGVKKIAHEATITLIGVLFGVGLKYVSAVIIARHIGAFSFGAFSLGITILSIAHILSVLGLNYGVLRYVSIHYSGEKREKISGIILSALLSALVASLFIGLLLFFGAETVSARIFSKGELRSILQWLSLSLPFLAVIEISVFSLQALQTLKYKVYVKEFFQQCLYLCIALIFLFMGLKVMGVVYAYLLSAFMSSLLSLYYLRNNFPDLGNRELHRFSGFKPLLRFSVPVLGMNIFGLGMIWTDMLMLGYFATSWSVGVYSAAAKAAVLIEIILFSFNGIFMPMVSDLYHRGELKQLESLFKTVTKWIFTLSFPLFLIIFLLSKEIMGIFGDEFIIGFPCLLILAIGQVVNASAGPVGNFLIMSGRQDIVLLGTAVSFGLNIILNYILIRGYGIVGAAMATAVTQVFLNLTFLIKVYHFYRIHPYNLKFLKPLLSGLGAGLIGLGLYSLVKASSPWTIFPLVILVFGFCYVIFLYLFRLDEEDKIITEAIFRKYSMVLKRY